MNSAVTTIALDRYLVTMLPKYMTPIDFNCDTIIVDIYHKHYTMSVNRNTDESSLLQLVTQQYGDDAYHIVRTIQMMKVHMSEALERQDSWSL